MGNVRCIRGCIRRVTGWITWCGGGGGNILRLGYRGNGLNIEIMGWSRVSQVLSEVMGTRIPLLPNVLMLNDDSAIGFTIPQRRLFLLGLTAAKKLPATDG